MASTALLGAPPGLDEADVPDVVRAAQRGDTEAMDELARSYYRPALRVAVRLLGNVEDATEATQEAFLRVHKAIREFRHPWSFRAWLLKIVRNVCFSEIRRRSSHSVVSGLEECDVTDPTDVEAVVVDRVLHDEVKEKLNTLPRQHREAIVLRDVEGCSTDEAARQLGITPGALRVRLHRARRALRDQLRR